MSARRDRRRRGLVLVVVAALFLATGAWIASLVIESPREAAANAEAPPPTLITVPVERRTVGEELVTRGLVTATQTVEAIGPGAGQGADRALISGHLPTPGQRIEAGDVVVEISGRPVIALGGTVPAYRRLSPGDTGPDVRQLNAALAGAGLGVDPGSSRYDEKTGDAVTSLFRSAGYASDGALPSSEVLFVSALPASVVAVDGAVGADVGAASIKVASGELTVSAEFPAAQAGLLQPGAEVVLSSEVLGKSASATLQPAGAEQGGPVNDDGADADDADDGEAEGVSGAGAAYTIVPDQPLGAAWAGQDVKVRVVSATTKKKVLAVPLTAIVASGAGDPEVVVVADGATSIADADPRRVPVTVGAIGGGWAEVVPAGGATLAPGDAVQLSATTASGRP